MREKSRQLKACLHTCIFVNLAISEIFGLKMEKNEFQTFGCRLNSYETDRMKELARQSGLNDVIIFNSCGVTNEAVRQVKQSIRKARRTSPDKKIIVTGCAAQMHTDQFEAMEEVDVILGNHEKLKLESFQALCDKENIARVRVSDIMEINATAPHLTAAFEGRTRSFVEIQNGCDHRCTFCIIPFGRGPSRSTPAEQIIHTIAELTHEGIHEVVLTGVDITDYQAPDRQDKGSSYLLGHLVKDILNKVPALERLRLSSIDAIEIDPTLMELLIHEPRLMPHLHLSLQSGSNMILKRMKRRHAREDAIHLCDRLRNTRPDIVFGADLIAGFPTETEAMFEDSCRLVEECQLTYLHIFPFSPREGTPAARMPQLDRQLIKSRARTLRELGNKRLQIHFEDCQNRKCDVLMETRQKGRTPWFSEIELDKPHAAGQIISTLVTGHTENKLTGVAI